jgi:hypothetical protein
MGAAPAAERADAHNAQRVEQGRDVGLSGAHGTGAGKVCRWVRQDCDMTAIAALIWLRLLHLINHQRLHLLFLAALQLQA